MIRKNRIKIFYPLKELLLTPDKRPPKSNSALVQGTVKPSCKMILGRIQFFPAQNFIPCLMNASSLKILSLAQKVLFLLLCTCDTMCIALPFIWFVFFLLLICAFVGLRVCVCVLCVLVSGGRKGGCLCFFHLITSL